MQGVLRGLLAGLLLAVIEVAVVAAHDYTLFFTIRDFGRYALLAGLVLPALGAVFGGLGSVYSRFDRAPLPPVGEREGWKTQSAVFGPLLILGGVIISPLLRDLTEGRRVRDLPGRSLLIFIVSTLMAVALAWFASFVWRVVRAGVPLRRRALGLFVVAIIAVVVNAIVLRRLYPAFHLGLFYAAWVLALGAVALALPMPRTDVLLAKRLVGAARPAAAVALVLAVSGVLFARAVAEMPGLRFPIDVAAPLTGRLLNILCVKPRAAPQASSPAPAPLKVDAVAAARAQTVDLRDRDILLITIDALRADRLTAYGAKQPIAPHLDALATESRVFLRAYTPTPHTSYALISLLSAKPIGLLYALSSLHEPPVTLPMLLRRHGYRTAAFYPPAIFYVDSDRFTQLADQHMGFEYVKAMYAPAADRVDQLRAYLTAAEPKHPLFVWVHLFEPHEPYEPAAPFAAPEGATPEQRYDAEVRAADAAVGGLVEVFRAARPNATVILSADHGEEFGDHGGHHHGTTLFDEQARVPLLWSSPGEVEPGPSSAPVDLIDLTTTVLSALGIPKDARMQGDDLGAVLADRSAHGPAFAFASLPDLAMTTDGALKLLCMHKSNSCQLFDLAADPDERRDVSSERAADATRLREGWNAFVAEVPRTEALDLSGQAWPPALARARLGDASVSYELTALLGSPRAEVRAEAARALGELEAAHAKPVLARLLDSESDPSVAAEVAIAALRLGYEPAVAPAVALLATSTASPGEPPPLQAREAAVALAHAGHCEGEGVLARAASATTLAEPERLAAISALGTCKRVARETLAALSVLFEESRMREPVARALGAMGDKRAVPVLRKALKVEVYPEARAAEVAALQALGDGAAAERLRKQSETFAAKQRPKEEAPRTAP